MEIGLVKRIDIDKEVKLAYMDYAMSVIVARALPDSRDGLKPVHRRILYAMRDMGVGPDAPYKKSARIVGEVLGKYHPHGDMAVYEAMARMAQEFSMRYPMIDGQGNFGSIDGDSPAAMRYTEARLANPAMYLLDDIEKNTVDFDVNFDGSLHEPTVLPSAIPNLLINGASGIAVGMATSIPPHNLAEIIDALQYVLKNWKKVDDISIDELMQFVQGPDFPTGGVIIQDESGDSLVSAYSTGKGKLTIRASAHLEEMTRGRSRIIVSELPYLANKSSLIERIAELVRESKLEGIADLRDESDRHGMRIVIEINKNANPEAVLGNLYKLTPMQNTFSIIMLALVDGEPRLLSLKQALRVYLEHRLEIVRRRSMFDLAKARNRSHLLEGIRIALENLDEVIELIRRSQDVNTARSRLERRFRLSEIQAQAILDFPLRRLAALERKKIELEYKDVLKQIEFLDSLLKSPLKMRNLVNDELQSVKAKFSDKRRTSIAYLSKRLSKRTPLTTTDLTPEKATWISVTAQGFISRTSSKNLPRMSGRNAPFWLVSANSRDILYMIAESGIAVSLPVHSLPETDNPDEGVSYKRVSTFPETEKIAAIFSLPSRKNQTENGRDQNFCFVITVTKKGMLKKSAISELPGASADPFVFVRINPMDTLVDLKISNGQNEILLVTREGMAIRFNENEVRPMGLVAAGVSGIKLGEADQVIGLDLLPTAGEVFFVDSRGYGKRINPEQFPKQGRYGQGVIAWNLGTDSHVVGFTIGKGTKKVILHTRRLLPKSIRLDSAPIQNRTARGKAIPTIKGDDQVKRLVVPWEIPK